MVGKCDYKSIRDAMLSRAPLPMQRIPLASWAPSDFSDPQRCASYDFALPVACPSNVVIHRRLDLLLVCP